MLFFKRAKKNERNHAPIPLFTKCLLIHIKALTPSALLQSFIVHINSQCFIKNKARKTRQNEAFQRTKHDYHFYTKSRINATK